MCREMVHASHAFFFVPPLSYFSPSFPTRRLRHAHVHTRPSYRGRRIKRRRSTAHAKANTKNNNHQRSRFRATPFKALHSLLLTLVFPLCHAHLFVSRFLVCLFVPLHLAQDLYREHSRFHTQNTTLLPTLAFVERASLLHPLTRNSFAGCSSCTFCVRVRVCVCVCVWNQPSICKTRTGTRSPCTFFSSSSSSLVRL